MKNRIEFPASEKVYMTGTHYPDLHVGMRKVEQMPTVTVKDGKKELNFSEWDSLSVRRKKSKLKAIASQIQDDEMPLSSYTIIHKDAKFTKAEKQEMIQWMTQKRDSL